MTTNVFCQSAAMLSTDSRWSVSLPHAAIYVDDVPFEKIAAAEKRGLVFMFAGDSDKIDEWKKWVWNPGHAVINRPPVSRGISICMVDIKSRSVAFEHNQAITDPGALFAGTGAWSAYQCWKKNKDPRKAVETAKLADRLSGGQVKFFDLVTGKNNLQLPDDFSSIRLGTLQRGMVMYFQNPAHVPLKDAVANDPQVAELAEKVKKGDCKMTAPSASAENDWSVEDEQRLDAALGKYFPAA